MIAHGSVIRAADAAKERLVTGSGGRVHVGELLRGVANELNQFGRSGLRVTGMRVLGMPALQHPSAAISVAAAATLLNSVRRRIRVLNL